MVWSVLGESVIGTSHRTRNVPCQDATWFRAFGPSSAWLVVAVADGAGSAAHSQVGAALACESFVHRVESFEPGLLTVRDQVISHVSWRIDAR